jgi:glycine cleavage system H protein
VIWFLWATLKWVPSSQRAVESVKAASDIYAPVAGEIVGFNEALNDAPETINASPYGTWIFKIKANNPADVNGLLDAAGYQAVADAS